MVDPWCSSSFQGIERERCIVERAMLPSPQEHTNPCERQRPNGGLMRGTLLAVLLVVGAGPEGMPRGFSRPFHERWSQAGGTLEAPVHPGSVAAAFRHQRTTSVLLELIGRGVTFAWFAEGTEETWGNDRASAWSGIK